MTSSLDEINPNCLLPRLSISSTSASLLSMPVANPDHHQLQQLPILSPVKNKPIGAERSNNSARNSVISPKDILDVVNLTAQTDKITPKILTPPPQASTAAYSCPQRPNSTSCVSKPSTAATDFVQATKAAPEPSVLRPSNTGGKLKLKIFCLKNKVQNIA